MLSQWWTVICRFSCHLPEVKVHNKDRWLYRETEHAEQCNINYASGIQAHLFHRFHLSFTSSTFLFIYSSYRSLASLSSYHQSKKMEGNRASLLLYRSHYKLWIKSWQWINKFSPEGERHQEAWRSTRNQCQWWINSSSNAIPYLWAEWPVSRWNRKLLYHWSSAGWTRSRWHVHPQRHSTHLSKTPRDSPWEKRLTV